MTRFQPRPTVYRGIQMRSRLEARFAEYLDWSDAAWRYEPMAFAGRGGQYLPDFELDQGGRTIFIEVRPTIEAAWSALARMPVIWESLPDAGLIVWVWGIGFWHRAAGEATWTWRAAFWDVP